jgi:hypothetical protein
VQSACAAVEGHGDRGLSALHRRPPPCWTGRMSGSPMRLTLMLIAGVLPAVALASRSSTTSGSGDGPKMVAAGLATPTPG